MKLAKSEKSKKVYKTQLKERAKKETGAKANAKEAKVKKVKKTRHWEVSEPTLALTTI